jgi:Mg2+ and Co2+ transporter CorA
MTMPDARAGRALLVESAGVDSDIDAEFAARLRKAGSFFWLDLSEVPPERIAEFSAALGLNADAAQHLADGGQRSGFTETHDGVRWMCCSTRQTTVATRRATPWRPSARPTPSAKAR